MAAGLGRTGGLWVVWLCGAVMESDTAMRSRLTHHLAVKGERLGGDAEVGEGRALKHLDSLVWVGWLVGLVGDVTQINQGY